MIAWYVCPYKYDPLENSRDTRYLAMQDFTNDIERSGGAWAEIEIDGAGANGIGHALVKVRATGVMFSILDSKFRRVAGDPRLEMTTQVRKPRYDKVANGIVLDGELRPIPRRFDDADKQVR